LNIEDWRLEGGMDEMELKQRTKEFAHRCVKLALELPNGQLGKHIAGQLIRCSTSVAANYRASCIAQSKASFISKLSIVLEEADESSFWLEFIVDIVNIQLIGLPQIFNFQFSLFNYIVRESRKWLTFWL
jgi:four helix bundle protein